MKEMINKNDMWVYEFEGGDCGIVIAETYGNALDELKKMYTQVDERLDKNWCKKNGFSWGLDVTEIDMFKQSENGKVLVTMPY